jgi:hypothetical protein
MPGRRIFNKTSQFIINMSHYVHIRIHTNDRTRVIQTTNYDLLITRKVQAIIVELCQFYV